MPYEWSTIAIIAVFGWPAVVVALVTFLVAVRLRQPALAILATVVSAPFCLFVSGYPLVGWWGVVVLFSNLLGALAVRRGLGGYAILLWVPFIALAAWLAVVVLGQPATLRV